MKRKVGRPKGSKMSEEARAKIAKALRGSRKSIKTKGDISTALIRYNRSLKRNIVKGVVQELDECGLTLVVAIRGIRRQVLYGFRGQAIRKRVFTIEILPNIDKVGELKTKLEKEMGMRKCPDGGYNIGTKIFVKVADGN